MATSIKLTAELFQFVAPNQDPAWFIAAKIALKGGLLLQIYSSLAIAFAAIHRSLRCKKKPLKK